MALQLTERELENIKTCRYTTNPPTKLDKVFDIWWEWLVNRVPKVSVILAQRRSASRFQILMECVFSTEHLS